MKKKVVALILCMAMSMSAASPVTASDFMEDSDLIMEQAEVDESEVPAQETEAVPEAAEVVEVPAESTEIEDFAEAVTEFDETEPESAEVEIEAGAEAEDEIVDVIPETVEDDFADIDFEEPPMAMAGEELGDGVVLDNYWEQKSVGGVLQFRLAKKIVEEPESASASENMDKEFDPMVPEDAQAGVRVYYTKADGIVSVKTVNSKGAVVAEGQYLFDEKGILITGESLVAAGTPGFSSKKDKECFFMDTAHAVKKSGVTAAATPLNSNLGQLQKKCWIWNGKQYHYFDENGVIYTEAERRAAEEKAGTYKGFRKINGTYYILKDDGTPRTGDYTMKTGIRQGEYYCYPEKNAEGIPGKMAISTWVYIKNDSGERWRHYNSSGRRDTIGITATKLDKSLLSTINESKLYLLNEKGYLYKKATVQTTSKGATYACSSKGICYKEKLVKWNGERYYFGKNGKLVSWKNSWHRCPGAGNRNYYFGSTAGKIEEKHGWISIKNSKGNAYWYYFNKNGNHLISILNNDYYFDEYGRLASGLKKLNGKYYMFELSDANTHRGKMVKGKLFTYKDATYYANSAGVVSQSKWESINGGYYYFASNGKLKTDTYLKKDGKYGYVDKTGKYTTGWVVVDASRNKVKYINPDKPGYAANEAKIINGVRYYFDSEGYRVTDLSKFNLKDKSDDILTKIHNGSYRYYLEVDKTNGVMTVYTGSDKAIPVKTIRVSVGTPISLTPNGTFTLHRSARWQPLMGPSWGQYGTHVVNGIFVHSIACGSANSYNLPASAYDRLGSPASHGCIRCCVADAKWVYDHCNTSNIRIFEGAYQSQEYQKGPLGRNPLVPRYGAGNFDPTDPAV